MIYPEFDAMFGRFLNKAPYSEEQVRALLEYAHVKGVGWGMKDMYDTLRPEIREEKMKCTCGLEVPANTLVPEREKGVISVDALLDILNKSVAAQTERERLMGYDVPSAILQVWMDAVHDLNNGRGLRTR